MARRLILIAAGLLLAGSVLWLLYSRPRPQATSSSITSGLPPFPQVQRLLILAPHCDDETLAAGGVIQAAVQQGAEVRVVIATNGDGFLFATMEEFRRVFPRPTDYIKLGELRQQESIRALSLLGVPEDHVTFLSYPDRGTPSLWNEYWLSTEPFHSPYTDSSRSPYPITYNPNAVYSGESLLADLTSILGSFRPDLVLYPHPDDVHPDHWGLSVFVRLALAQLERADSTFQPAAYAYLVHRPDFPSPKKYLPQDDLLPPKALSRVTSAWYRFDLSPDETLTKWKALLQYRSQLGFLRRLFEGFVRRNELFELRNPVRLPQLAAGDPSDPTTWRDPSGASIAPVVLDPVRDFIVRDAVAAADLVAAYAARTRDDRLALCLESRSEAETPLQYILRATGFGADGSRHASVGRIDKESGRFACFLTSMHDLGDPWILFIGGEVHAAGAGVLDQTAWEVVLP